MSSSSGLKYENIRSGCTASQCQYTSDSSGCDLTTRFPGNPIVPYDESNATEMCSWELLPISVYWLCICASLPINYWSILQSGITTTFPIQLYLYNPVELSQNQWWPWHSMVSLYRVCVTNTLKAESKMVLVLWEKSVLSRPPLCRDSSTHTSFSNKIVWFSMPRCLVLCLTSLGHDDFIDHAVYCGWQHTNRRRWLSMAKQQRLDHKQPLICSLLPPCPVKFVCRRAIKLLLYVMLALSRQMLY